MTLSFESKKKKDDEDTLQLTRTNNIMPVKKQTNKQFTGRDFVSLLYILLCNDNYPF